jgi:hypothetical protein
MAYEYGPSKKDRKYGSSLKQVYDIFLAKVISTDLSTVDPESTFKIKYTKDLDNPVSRDSTAYSTALPYSSAYKKPPLPGEVVLVIRTQIKSQGKTSTPLENSYYLEPLNLWKHPQHGQTPIGNEDNVTTVKDFTERSDINPLTPYAGDVLFEGRQGQSLRFSQSIPNKTPWNGPLGEPIMVLSNGQVTVNNGFEYIKEDVNEDYASLYLTSTQKLPLTPGNKLTQPLNEYDQPQAILTSGRVVLNARDNNLILSTPAALEASGRVVNIKAEDTITSEAPQIKLGEQADQKAILGDRMLADLSAVLIELTKVTAALGSLGIAPLTAPAASFTERATRFILEVEQMKSNKVLIQK